MTAEILAKFGNVVEIHKIGNTTCYICDDCCRDKSKEGIDAIIRKISYKAQRALSEQAAMHRLQSNGSIR